MPARPRMPDPFPRQDERQENVDSKHIRFIDRLREAAKEHGAVADLLGALSDSILIDDLGNREIVGDKDSIEWIKAAILAEAFVAMDIEQKEKGR